MGRGGFLPPRAEGGLLAPPPVSGWGDKSFIPKGAFARHIAVSPHIPFNTAIENKEPFANDPLLRRHGSGTRNIANRFVRSSEKASLVKKTWTV